MPTLMSAIFSLLSFRFRSRANWELEVVAPGGGDENGGGRPAASLD
jgi:hypothetical protein